MANAKKKSAPKRQTARERMRSQFSGQGAGDFPNVVKPQPGKNYYRILPPKSLDTQYDDFYVYRLQHFYDNKPVICSKTESRRADCAICDEWEATKKIDEESARKIAPKKVYFMNAMKLEGYPKAKGLPKKPEILVVGKQAMDQIADKYQDDEDGGEFWGEDCGRKGVAYDILINRKGTGINTEYLVSQAMKLIHLPTPDALLKNLHDLDAEFPICSSDDIDALISPAPKKKSIKEEETDDDDDEDEDEEEDEEEDDEEEVNEAEDEDEEEDDEEEVDEDEDEDEDEEEEEEEADDDDDEEDDEKASPVKKKASLKKVKTDKKLLRNALRGRQRKTA